MKKRVIYILVIVLVLISVTACKKKTQTPLVLGNVKGTVLSKQTNQPIYGVTVEVVSGTTVKKLETNQNGQYSTAVPVGNIVITASRAGYISQKVTAVLEKNAQLNIAPIVLVLEEGAISIEGTATFAAASPPDWSANVYAEVSIWDDGQKYADMRPIGGTLKTFNYFIEGINRDRNYIIAARAANLPENAKIDGPKTQTNKNIIRKSELADPDQNTFTINIGPETNQLVAAIELYLANTGRGLNDPGVDADLDAIQEAAIQEAANPRQKAIELSTTIVQGTIQDILGEPLGGATVVIVSSDPQKSAVSAGDGTFAITEVPIRYQGVTAEAPRYLKARQDGLELTAGEPYNLTLELDPDPAVIADDLKEAAALMADNSSGDLSKWLTGDFSYTFPEEASKDKATAIAELPASYVAIYPGPDTIYNCVSDSKTEFRFENDNWTMRRESTYVRCSYRASGTVRYGNKRWQLVSLTLSDEVSLPKAPTDLKATPGDASAVVGWTAPIPADPEIDGYRIYRTATATPPADTAPPTGSVAGGSVSFTEVSLATGRYYYWVRSVDEYSGVEILSAYSLPKEVYVVNALETIQQFVAHALARDKVGITAMLASDFEWLPVGKLNPSIDKKAFIDYLYLQFSTTTPLACSWNLKLGDPTFKRDAIGNYAIIEVPGSLAGRFSDLYPNRTRRWLETLETWEISLTDGKLKYFSAGSRELYPGAPKGFNCTNMYTIDEDNFVRLVWQKPNDPKLAGYKLFEGSVGDFKLAEEVDVDIFVPSQTIDLPKLDMPVSQHFYWIVAYDTYGETSVPSSPVLIGVPNEIRELAENFLNASYRKSEAEVRLYTSFDFSAFLQNKEEYPLDKYCDFVKFAMAKSPYNLVYYQVKNPVSKGGFGGGSDWNGIRASDDWTRYELTFIKKGDDEDPISICTWSGITCMAITVRIAKIDDKWRVYQADFLDIY